MLQNMYLSFVVNSYMHVHIYTSPMLGGHCRGLPEHTTAAVDTYRYKHPAAHVVQHLMHVVNESSRGEHNPEAYGTTCGVYGLLRRFTSCD